MLNMTQSSYDRGLGLVYIFDGKVDIREYGLTFQMNGRPKTWPYNWVWARDRHLGNNNDYDIPANWTYG